MDPDDEDLIPPSLSITLPPIPLPLRPPTKEDVDRAENLMNMVKATLSASREDLDNIHNYYLRVCEKYEQSAGLAGHTVTDVLVAIRNEMRAMREGSDRQFRDLGGQVSELKHQSIMQLEIDWYKARNRELTESGQPATEVVFLDGSPPSSHDIQALNSNQYVRGQGFGATVAEIKDRLSGELGVVQATE
ncbi:hypothetical protein POJ06DRAFT_304504 [Lipomyces tetrasporus]|uniref:Uncharacterized protein n=1 Tax=Lipomyces tetrasporus TaxID=54092 RepID=A0AAD7VP97_9ASCO|nr:uncharacterized protein POJ06DRAFT_304504 [Lipomyces tetrasporus]KAJ8096461.1 hypothetical protein POJ06DRAFT_304504 [Lipomyces tetrasporus]